METSPRSLESQAKPPKPASKTIPGVILRIILVLIVGCLVGAVVYFSASGWIPYLDQRIFQPIDTHQAIIQELRATQSALGEQLSSLQSTLDPSLSGGKSDLQATLEQVADALASIKNQVDSNTYYAGTMAPAMLATVSAQQEANTRFLSAIATAQMKEAGNRQEIDLLRSLNSMVWAHQYILHDNYGLAENELKVARDQLSAMITRVGPEQRVVLFEMVELIGECIADLPSRPAIAAEKLQAAWQMGISEFPGQTLSGQNATATPTLTTTPNPE